MESNFIKDLNDAMKQGLPTTKSKKAELVPKIAVSIHLLEHYFIKASGHNLHEIHEEISLDTFNKASYFVDTLEQLKELFSIVSKSLPLTANLQNTHICCSKFLELNFLSKWNMFGLCL